MGDPNQPSPSPTHPHTVQPTQTGQGDVTGGVIPYKNPCALIAYYLAVFSLLPVVGLLLGVAAVVLGIIGLRYRRAHPQSKGTVHAWIGIIGGGAMAVIWGGCVGLIVLAALTGELK